MAKLNNPTPDSEEEQSEKGTELEEGKKKEEKEEVALPEKFKSTEELVKAYNELEKKSTKDSTQLGKQGERLAKLEGIQEAQKKAEQKLPPQISSEERKAMEKRFRDDFQKDALGTLHNFNRPYMEDARLANERATKLESELAGFKSKQEDREMRDFAAKARGTGDNAKLFDEMIPQIQDELKKNPTWKDFEDPYEAVFSYLKGKSTKNLARVDDADVESHVEGSSDVIPDTDKKKKYVGKIIKARTDTRL